MSYPGQIPPGYPYIPPPYIHPPISTQVSNPTPTSLTSTANSDASNTAFDRPITTVFVGDISDKIPDELMKEILTKCGNVLSWKRVQVASSFKAFGFCEYDNPEATLRCIRLLNEFKIANKALKVKVDPKTDELLSEYKTKKRKAIEVRESEDLSKSEEARKEKIAAIYAKETEEDKNVLKQIKKLINDSGLESSDNEKHKKEKYDASRKLHIEKVELATDEKEQISKEIEIFRNKHKDDEAKDDEERYKRIREREKERGKDKDREKEPKDKHRRKRSRSRSRNDEIKKKSKLGSRDSTPSVKKRSHSKDTHRSNKRKKENDKELDEYEAAIMKKYEKKLREKEAAYQKRLLGWEGREKKKMKEYEMELSKKAQKDREISEEARKLQVFFEDYDDEKCDMKYYRGPELERRLNSRRTEEISDERDKAKELEQIENTRQRLIKEQNPNVDDIISKMEESMQEHLQRKLLIESVAQSNKPDDSNQQEQSNLTTNHIDRKSEEKPEESLSLKPEDVQEPITEEIPSLPTVTNTKQSSPKLEASSLYTEETDSTPATTQPSSQEDMTSTTTTCSTQEPATQPQLLNQQESLITESVEMQYQKPISEAEKKALVKQIIDNIPTVKTDLFAYEVDWSHVDDEFVEARIKPWVKKKIVAYIGEDEPSLSQFICDQVLQHKTPDQILADIAMVLEEEADVFVMKMWRLLIYVIEEKKAGL